MDFNDINTRGLVLVGCGRMGGAMLTGWLKNGIKPEAVTVIDPNARPDWANKGVRLNELPPENPAVLVLAVKPQMMADVLPRLGNGTAVAVKTVDHQSRAIGDLRLQAKTATRRRVLPEGAAASPRRQCPLSLLSSGRPSSDAVKTSR